MTDEAPLSLCWVPSRRREWELRRVVRADGDVVVTEEEGEDEPWPRSDVHPYNDSHGELLDNVAYMDNVHIAPLLDLLRRRYDEDCIYTFTGDVLISLNPFKAIPGLYDISAFCSTAAKREAAQGSEPDAFRDDDSPPHVYTVALRAYEALLSSGSSQAVLVNGESGAGKTEASKYILRLLASLSADSGDGATDRASIADAAAEEDAAGDGAGAGTGRSAADLERRLLESNPVLEAFGNACTLRNDNSSRFGKFLRAHFDGEGRLCGADARQFLLERSRVCHHEPGERSFHIMHMLGAAAAAARRGQESVLGHDLTSALFLGSVADSPYLHATSGSRGSGGDASAADGAGAEGGEGSGEEEEAYWLGALRELLSAFTALGVDDEDVRGALSLAAAVLHMGMLRVGVADDADVSDPEAPSDVADDDAAAAACSLLGFPDTLSLRMPLIRRTLQAGGRRSMVVVNLTRKQATNARDAVAKAIYAALFHWIVDRVNEATEMAHAADEDGMAFIGILDIFGFEVFDANSFEQLCINYANEKLQQLFNRHVFDLEQALYQEQGVRLDTVTYHDNGPLLSLFEGPRTGILPVLESQALLGSRASDAAFLRDLYHAHGVRWTAGGQRGSSSATAKNDSGSSPSQFLCRPRIRGDATFTVVHYAGSVTYEAEGLLRKNNDSLPHDLRQLLLSSDNEILQGAMALMDIDTASNRGGADGAGAAQSGGRKMAAAASVSADFRAQMQRLVATLSQCRLQFVRCVKPCRSKAAGAFDPTFVANQLRYLGVIETVRIRRQGFPVRRPFAAVADAFWPLAANAPAESSGDPRAMCEHICGTFLDSDAWQCGHTRLFLRDGQLAALEASLARVRAAAAVRVQALARGVSSRHRVRRMHSAAAALTAAARAAAARRRARRAKEAATALATFRRGVLAKREAVRRRAEIDESRRQHEAAQRIGAVVRSAHARRHFVQQREAAQRLGALARGVAARREAARLRKEREAERAREEADLRSAAVALQRLVRQRKERQRQAEAEAEAEREKEREEQEAAEAAAAAVSSEEASERVRERRRLEELQRARSVWQSFLEADETLVHTSPCLKEGKGMLGRKTRRQLLLTSRPRLLLVDPAAMQLRGEIEWPSIVAVHVAAGQDYIFHIQTTGRAYTFTETLGSATAWKRHINALKQQGQTDAPSVIEYAADAVSQMKNAAVKQGHLVKRAVKSRRNWKRRFFVLTESGLFMYLKRDTDRTPLGCVQLVPHAMVRAFKSRPNSFVVLTPYTPAGVACTASSEDQCAAWVHAIRSVIRRVEQQQQRLMQQQHGEEDVSEGEGEEEMDIFERGAELAGDTTV